MLPKAIDYTETRNVLVDKVIKTYDLKKEDIADVVELFYDCQELRIRQGNRQRTEGPSELVLWLGVWIGHGEKVITGKLKQWVEGDDSPAEAKWAYDQFGIGPIIASGLAAHIDVARAKHISSVWKFAGLAPGFDRRVKGQKLPYNGRLKVLCWKLGESFVKVSGNPKATYGQLYAAFKANELERNAKGQYQAAAKAELERKSFRKDTATKKKLEAGLLSDAQLHARACRRTVKVFLAHYYQVAKEARGLDPGTPYVVGILGHENIIERASRNELSK